jgi:hypothetical protein
MEDCSDALEKEKGLILKLMEWQTLESSPFDFLLPDPEQIH